MTAGGLAGKTDINEATTSTGEAVAEKNAGINGGQQDSSNNTKDEETKTVPFLKLFSFADSTDVFLMIAGAMGAIGNGLGLPLVTVVSGEMINSLGSKDVVPLVSNVKKYADPRVRFC